MKPFRWKNCYADVTAWRHGITVRSFFDDVISPAIHAVEDKITALGRSGNPGDEFAQADMKEVLRETKMAFSLSIQSIWERQLRRYLRGCAEELQPGTNLGAQTANGSWEKLCSLFLDLRGIRLDAFPSFAELDTLHLLGNACRHGDGRSADKLAERCPDLWPGQSGRSLLVASIDVSMDQLERFVAAIAAFWDDAEYIYNESIERKHPSLKARLARERVERSWRPKVAPGDGAYRP